MTNYYFLYYYFSVIYKNPGRKEKRIRKSNFILNSAIKIMTFDRINYIPMYIHGFSDAHMIIRLLFIYHNNNPRLFIFK